MAALILTEIAYFCSKYVYSNICMFGITSLQNEVIFYKRMGVRPSFFCQFLGFIFNLFSFNMVIAVLSYFGEPKWLTSLVYQKYVINLLIKNLITNFVC